MTDQCKHCTYRGDIKACLAAECCQHENWYAVEQQKQIDELEHAVCEEIGNRDRWEESANALASLVGELLNLDFGEHTSANCPVTNAIEALERIDAVPEETALPTMSGFDLDWVGNKGRNNVL